MDPENAYSIEAPILEAQSLLGKAGIHGLVLKPPGALRRTVVSRKGEYLDPFAEDKSRIGHRVLSTLESLFSDLSDSWIASVDCGNLQLPLIAMRARCNNDMVDVFVLLTVRVVDPVAFVRWISNRPDGFDKRAGAPRPFYPTDLAVQARELLRAHVAPFVIQKTVNELRNADLEYSRELARKIENLVRGKRSQWGVDIVQATSENRVSPTSIGYIASRDTLLSQQNWLIEAAANALEATAILDHMAHDYGRSAADLVRALVASDSWANVSGGQRRALEMLLRSRDIAEQQWVNERFDVSAAAVDSTVASVSGDRPPFLIRHGPVTIRIISPIVLIIIFVIWLILDWEALREDRFRLTDLILTIVKYVLALLTEVAILAFSLWWERRQASTPVRISFASGEGEIPVAKISEYLAGWRERIHRQLLNVEQALADAAKARADCAGYESTAQSASIRRLVSFALSGHGAEPRPLTGWVKSSSLGDASWILREAYSQKRLVKLLEVDDGIGAALATLDDCAKKIGVVASSCGDLGEANKGYEAARQRLIEQLRLREALSPSRPIT